MKATVVAVSLFSSIATALPDRYASYGRYQGAGENLGKHGSYGKYEDVGAGYKDCTKGPIPFTSTFHVKATPDQVVNGTTPTGGQTGAVGYYDFGLNSDLNLICYNIHLVGLGDVGYQSLAKTATHVHQAAKGASGPPRLALPNPMPMGKDRVSVGCLQGPFTTGVMANGQDTGTGFTIKMLEDNPSAYMADVHTTVAVPGAVRGQFTSA